MGSLVARLKGVPDEDAQVLTSTQVKDRFGQPASQFTTTSGEVRRVQVQPLGAEEAFRFGLTLDRERLRVRLPAQTPLTIRDRLSLRGREWKVTHTEAWPSYVLAIVEVIP